MGTDGAREAEEVHRIGLKLLLQVFDAEGFHEFGELSGHEEIVELMKGRGVGGAEFAQQMDISFGLGADDFEFLAGVEPDAVAGTSPFGDVWAVDAVVAHLFELGNYFGIANVVGKGLVDEFASFGWKSGDFAGGMRTRDARGWCLFSCR